MQSICGAVQIDLSLVITNWESDALINPSDHDSVSDDCHSTESHITSFYFYGLTSHYPGNC